MCSKKIIVLETNTAIIDQMQEALREDEKYQLLYADDDGDLGLKKIYEEEPDVLIVGMFLKGTDGCGVIRATRRKFPTTTIIATGMSNDGLIERAMNCGADYYMLKPFAMSVLFERINELLYEEKEEAEVDSSSPKKRKYVSIDEKISEIFISIGIPPHIKGYGYLREGIKKTVEDPRVINGVTKELYPYIAEKFETTPSKVERAIRHGIEVAWNRGRIDAINAIFGSRVYLGSEKPTNSEFIALVADKLILENLL